MSKRFLMHTPAPPAGARVCRVSTETPAPPAPMPEEEPGRRFDRKTIIPLLAILALVVCPIAIWAATSGGGGDKLRIDQGVSVYGGPEIVVNVPKKLNTRARRTGLRTCG